MFQKKNGNHRNMYYFIYCLLNEIFSSSNYSTEWSSKQEAEFLFPGPRSSEPRVFVFMLSYTGDCIINGKAFLLHPATVTFLWQDRTGKNVDPNFRMVKNSANF
jgi:hypothetical protein